MKQHEHPKPPQREEATPAQRGLRESVLIVGFAVGAFLALSLFSYDPLDPAWSRADSTREAVHNAGGLAGAWFADISFYLFGVGAYGLPLLVWWLAWNYFRGSRESGYHWGLRTLGLVMALVGGTALAHLHWSGAGDGLPWGSGGLLGERMASAFVQWFSTTGGSLFLGVLLLVGVSLATRLSWLRLGGRGMGLVAVGMRGMGRGISAWRLHRRKRGAQQTVDSQVSLARKRKAGKAPPRDGRTEPIIVPRVTEKVKLPPKPAAPRRSGDFVLPALTLLDPPDPHQASLDEAGLESTSRLVESKLADFGITAQVVAVYPGPVITRYEIEPAPGTKASQITNLSRDLARSLSVISVRVVEVIPGKTTIGLEIPNPKREIVRLVEVLQSKAYTQARSPLTLALGKDISGEPVVADLAKMPHLLVAGTTGSGKSVAINAMILSLLYNATPEEVRLIMIDPKMLELSVYDGIPHLLAPVVTDMKEAATALRWCVAEMERRYKLMATFGVRNVAGFNKKLKEAQAQGEPLRDPFYEGAIEGQPPPELAPLPTIVVVVDELADLMMIVGKKVEELIARLAQKARAAGIHLILATQRPSVDVITGLIKANIPSRIAFQVSSRVDSRTILDQQGAEQLLGQGDMLYLPPGTGLPIRVHGAFVDDQEVHRVVEDLRSKGSPDYVEEVLQGGAGEESGILPGGNPEETDELYDQAVAFVLESRRASISAVQRKLKIGYNRAARMIEQMEQAGLVGPLQPNGSREVLAPPPPE